NYLIANRQYRRGCTRRKVRSRLARPQTRRFPRDVGHLLLEVVSIAEVEDTDGQDQQQRQRHREFDNLRTPGLADCSAYKPGHCSRVLGNKVHYCSLCICALAFMLMESG